MIHLHPHIKCEDIMLTKISQVVKIMGQKRTDLRVMLTFYVEVYVVGEKGSSLNKKLISVKIQVVMIHKQTI
jgi:hypothetical protein